MAAVPRAAGVLDVIARYPATAQVDAHGVTSRVVERDSRAPRRTWRGVAAWLALVVPLVVRRHRGPDVGHHPRAPSAARSARPSPGARPWSPPRTCSRVMFLAYGVVPHQWLTYADNELEAGAADKLVVGPGRRCLDKLPFTITYEHVRDIIVDGHLRRLPRRPDRPVGVVAEAGQEEGRRHRGHLHLRPSPGQEGLSDGPHRRQPADAGVPRRLHLVEVDADYLAQGGQAQAVHPHRPVRVHHVRGLRRHLPVEVHPHGHARTPSTRPSNTEQPGARPERPRDLRDRRRRVHPVRPLRRPVPDRRDHHGQGRRGARATATPHQRTNNHGYAYGMRF